MASTGARAYNGGLATETPVRSRAKPLVRGQGPLNLTTVLLYNLRMEVHFLNYFELFRLKQDHTVFSTTD